MGLMETMLLTPIGILSCGVILSLALITLVKLKRGREITEARLSRGLRQYVGTAERVECVAAPFPATVLQ